MSRSYPDHIEHDHYRVIVMAREVEELDAAIRARLDANKQDERRAKMLRATIMAFEAELAAQAVQAVA